MEKRKLSVKETIVIASTLFGMFFGAGNLIFPVSMGQQAGSNVWPAILGFIITGVGIPILGVAAIGVTHSRGLQDLSAKVGKGYSYFFTIALYLTIGPFFAIPRCATTSFSSGIVHLLPASLDEGLALFLFSAAFFTVVLLLSWHPGKITTSIGRVINPLFLVFLAILAVVAVAAPSAKISDVAPTGNYIDSSFFQGFLNGYNTMDAIASLAFGIIVVNAIKGMGIERDDDVAKGTLSAGVFAGLLMAIIYVITTVMGTQSRGAFGIAANGGDVLADIGTYYLGTAGLVVLAFTITLACLKTALGLVTSCAETFSEMFPGRLSQKTWATIFTLFSFAVSNVGLSALIKYSVPVLMLLYPLAIVLIALAMSEKFFGGAREVYVGAITAAFLAAVFDFIAALPFGIDVSFAGKFLPFYKLGLGWVVPSIIGSIAGLIISRRKAA